MDLHPSPRPPSPPGRPLGRVEIADEVLQQIVGHAVLECYGVVGMASRGPVRGAVRLLARDSITQGVVVRRDGGVHVDLYVVMEYGLKLAEVAANVRSQVRYTLERDTRLPVASVQVHIQAVRRTEAGR